MALFSRVFLCLLLVTTLLLATVTCDLDNDYHETYKASDASVWDVLEAIANHTTSLGYHNFTSFRDPQLYQLWGDYLSSSSTKTAMDKALAHQYVNSRITMAAWLLFGPEKAQSNLRSLIPPHRSIDDLQCVESTVQSFIKHCGLGFADGWFMHRRWFSNICRYAPNKEIIDKAFFASCVMTRVTTGAENYYDEPRKASTNVSTWEILEAIANTTSLLHYPSSLCSKDPQLYRLWGDHLESLRSKTPSTMKILAKKFADKEYISSRIKMAAIILFGPEKAWSTLRSPQRRKVHCVDNLQCLRSTVKLFADHCGFKSSSFLPHTTSFLNLCSHVDDKAAIKEAFMAACGMKNVEAYAVNVKNSTMRVIPTPMRGSSDYCERVYVNGESRVKLQSFSKKYSVLLRPSETWGWHDKAQICVHRNASLGLCQCEKGDWKPLENELWSFVMSPYDLRIIDVKFSRGIEGSVTVSLYEVLDVRHFAYLITGVALLILAPRDSKYLVSINAHYVVARFSKQVLCVVGVLCIFQSSMDTQLAMVAVFCYLTLYYLSCISRDRKILRRGTGQEAVSDRETGTGQEAVSNRETGTGQETCKARDV